MVDIKEGFQITLELSSVEFQKSRREREREREREKERERKIKGPAALL